ncbi:MAG: helix-turn-helix domain-containing protein [Proteobacteria bacterium]|nr:helix-turn-helix domain-containing protein [Pseudomonadota bacterium]
MGKYISCGIPYLDKLMGGILLGDNVVWVVQPGTYFDYFSEQFLTAKDPKRFKTVYVSFDFPPHKICTRYERLFDHGDFILVDAFTFGKGKGDNYFQSFYDDESISSNTDIICIKHMAEPEVFINTMSELQGKFKDGFLCKYVFDSLTGMQELWGERDTLHFFTYTCPKLFELKALAYWPIVKEAHSKSFLANVTHITQLVISLSFQKDRTCVTSFLKMDGRPSELLREKHYYSFHDNKLNFVGSAEQTETSRAPGETRLTAEGQEKTARFPQKGLVQIGARIRDLRLKKHVPQIELARILQITPSALSQIENNQSFPSLPLFIDIARYFDESLDSLLAGTTALNKTSRNRPKKG